mgnify:CR=1 FL=1
MDRYKYALLGVGVRDVRYPFAVGSVCVKLPVEQILVLVELLPHLLPFPVTADFRQQIVFFHDPQHRFGIAKYILAFQPQPHPPVAIGTEAAFPLLCNEFRKSCVLLRSAKALDKTIIAASGYTKKRTHDGYWIFLPVSIYDVVFCPRPHFLPMNCRKSRSSLFSMRSLWNL